MSRIEEGQDFLEHYGVKGMQWGVRKSRVVGNEAGTDITKGDQKWKAKKSTLRNHVEIINKMGAEINKDLVGLNQKYEGKNLGYDPVAQTYNNATGKKYVKEYEAMASKHANTAAKEVFGISPSGNWTVSAKYTVDQGLQVSIDPAKKVEHSSAEETETGLLLTLTVDQDANGLFLPLSPESLRHDAIDTFLEHYGVKGMKWGVRRAAKRAKKQSRKDFKTANKNEKKRRKKAAATRRVVDEKEIDALVRRIEKEKRLKSLVAEDSPASKAAVSRILGETGSQVAKQVAAGVAVSIISVAIANKMGSTGEKGADRATNTAKDIQKAIKVGGRFKDK